MNSNNNPDTDPSNNDSFPGTLRFAFQKMMQQVNGMLPARVIAYNRTTNRVQVELLIAVVGTSGAQFPRPQIASIPVLVLGGGGYFLSFPLKVGDLGWVLASDRDISLFLQSYTQAPPNTQRMMNFSDGMFIPDVMTDYTIEDEDEQNVVFSSLDGSVRIAIADTGTIKEIKMTAGSVVIDIKNDSAGLKQVIVTSPDGTIINGNLIVTGTISSAGFGVTGGQVEITETPPGTLHLTNTLGGAAKANLTASGVITPNVGP